MPKPRFNFNSIDDFIRDYDARARREGKKWERQKPTWDERIQMIKLVRRELKAAVDAAARKEPV